MVAETEITEAVVSEAPSANGAVEVRDTNYYDLPVHISELPPDEALEGERPVGNLTDQVIERQGLMERILFAQTGGDGTPDFSDAANLIAGRRRIQAVRAAIARLEDEAAILDTNGDNGAAEKRALAAKLSEVPVRVMVTQPAAVYVSRVVSHATRRDNYVVELEAMEQLVALGYDDARIAKECSTNVAHVRFILGIGRLIPEMREALHAGAISGWVGYAVSSESEQAQRHLLDVLREKGKLVTSEVERFKRAKRTTAVASLGDSILVGDDLPIGEGGDGDNPRPFVPLATLLAQQLEEAQATIQAHEQRINELEMLLANERARRLKKPLPHPEVKG